VSSAIAPDPFLVGSAIEQTSHERASLHQFNIVTELLAEQLLA
jgi:hypothetical protein